MSKEEKVEIEKLKLSNGLEIPKIGLGTFQKAIRYAIDIGYRHFDCAWAYNNESFVGPTILDAIAASRGAIKREDLFIVSKVWDTFHSKRLTKMALNETLRDMGLSYIDLYLIHWPIGLKEETGEIVPRDESGKILFSDVHYLETFQGLEELLAEGKVRSIGVSNFSIKQLQDVLDHASIKPVVNQIEVNPYFQNDQLIEFCQRNGVSVEGYAPFGSSIIPKQRPGLPLIVEHPVLKDIGAKYGKTAAQVCLRWGVQRNIIMLPKSVTPARILENTQIFDFALNDRDMARIKTLNQNIRTYPCAE